MAVHRQFQARLDVRLSVYRRHRKGALQYEALLWTPQAGVNVGYHPIEGAGRIDEATAKGSSAENAEKNLNRRVRGKIVVLEMQGIPQDEFRA